MKPNSALMMTTPSMIAASSHRPTINLTNPAPNSTYQTIFLSHQIHSEREGERNAVHKRVFDANDEQ